MPLFGHPYMTSPPKARKWFMRTLTLLLSIFRPTKWHARMRCQYDAHEYVDWKIKEPAHFYEAPCERCGKVFGI